MREASLIGDGDSERESDAPSRGLSRASWPGLDRLGRGEMVERVRELDWSQTPLGAIAEWSQSLRLAVATALASPFPIAIRWGPDLVLIYNDAYRCILGDKHPWALGRALREVWGEIWEELGPLSEAILRGERPAYFAADQLWPIERGAGSEAAHFTLSYSPIPDEAAPNGIGGTLCVCLETTEQVRNEAALRRLNETLEYRVAERTRERDRIWQVSEDLLGVCTLDGYFISVNPAWTALLGWSAEEIRHIHVDDLRHPDDAAKAKAARARLRAGKVQTVRMENRLRHKDGSWRWIYWTMTAEAGFIYVIGRHVTAEKEAAQALREAQEQLAQSQKMEALGQLTGGIAHDFNNLLMVISGNAQNLLRRLRQPNDRRAAEAIERAAAGGESLTRQLLAFSRRQPLSPTVVDLGARLDAARDLLASSVRDNIELIIDVPAGCWPVAVDVSELELALVNLVVNARDAIVGSGTIRIAARNRRLDIADTPEGLNGEFVGVAVSDNGDGIPGELLSKIFDPFFTTKEPGKGTGLGLSQVYGFTRQSGGTVTVGSREKAGTTVTLYLPRSRAPLAGDGEPTPAAERASAHETVLLVEDNPEVQRVAAMMLEQLGYRVVRADNADIALTLLGGGDRVALVFSDIMMPGRLDGLALARRIRENWPRLPVLLTTGYAAAANTVGSGFPVLRKPYRLPGLARAVREALASQAGTDARSA